MTAPLLDALLAQPEEAAQHDLHDAARPRPGPDLKAALERLSPAEQRRQRKHVEALKRAVRCIHDDKPTDAARLAMKVLDAEPDNAIANQVVGAAMERLGRLSAALTFYERAWKRDPQSPDLYQCLAMVAWKLDMLPAAEKFLRIYCQLQPAAADGPINLGGVLRDQGRFEDALEVLRAAVYANPEHAALWNSLGTVLIESGEAEEAQIFYREALRLEPDYARAHNNLAYALELTGDTGLAVAHFDEAAKNPASKRDRAAILHGRSLSLLAAGRLEEAWDAYQIRLDPDYAEATLFSLGGTPLWDGANPRELRGKRLLLVGEQGLGDEVMFLNAARDTIDAVGPEGKVAIACEKRLVPLVARSYPDAIVASHASTRLEGRDVRAAPKAIAEHGPFDYWAPMGHPMRAFRRRVEDFPGGKGHFIADEAEVERWRAQLAAMGPGLKVGLLWKSLKMNAKRSKFFSGFEAWEPVVRTPGVTFVNLQYGDSAEELAQAKAQFGVDIRQPEGIDLKLELDRIAALGKALDIVIGPMNATTNLAAAVGGEVWILNAHRFAWTTFATDRLPWYPTARVFSGDGFGDWAGVMRKAAEALAGRAKKAKAA